jgi:hypothetical protein
MDGDDLSAAPDAARSGPGRVTDRRFTPALELNREFFREVVAPIVVPWAHSAALLGWGSDVLGLDSSRSTDHGWGPRLQVFVARHDVEAVRVAIDEGLPERFRGWPVRYGWDATPVRHHVDVAILREWLECQLGLDPRLGMDVEDWLVIPQQQLLGVVRGAVYADQTGELEEARRLLRWYPHDVWLWMLACQWQRIAQEEAFVGRTAEVGDELGSRVVAARLVRELMRLCLLMGRRYQPYSKWLGSEFSRMDDPDSLGEALVTVLSAGDHRSREAALAASYTRAAARHNRLGMTEEVDPAVRYYHGRPFTVLMAGRFVQACLRGVGDERLRGLPLAGSVDQVTDSTELLSHPGRARRLGRLYRA